MQRATRVRLFILGLFILLGGFFLRVATTGFVTGELRFGGLDTVSIIGLVVVVLSVALISGEISWDWQRRAEEKRQQGIRRLI